MDVLLAQIALFFVPGLIWASVEASFTPGARSNGALFFARAFLFGAVTNAVIFTGYSISGFTYFDLSMFEATGLADISTVFDELSISVFVAGFFSILWLYLGTHRILVHFLNRIGVTHRLGDDTVWEFLMNADQASVEYAHIRDKKHDVVICGWIDSFSEASELREFLLRDVIVYDLAGRIVSQPPYLYVSRDRSDLWIEFPYAERETKRFAKQKVGTIKQILAGDLVKGGHNGLSQILDRPDPPFEEAFEDAIPKPTGPGNAGPGGPGAPASPPPTTTKRTLEPAVAPAAPDKVEPPSGAQQRNMFKRKFR